FLKSAEKESLQSGKQVADFVLKDGDGRPVSLAEFRDKKAFVVIFTGTECPINNAFMPRIAELYKTFAHQGVQFLAINANRQDSLHRIKEHAIANSIPFPVLKDADNSVADLFGAQRTPEAFILDSEHRIRYQGRIDD